MRVGALTFALIALSSCSSSIASRGDAAIDAATADETRDAALDASGDSVDGPSLDAPRDVTVDVAPDAPRDVTVDVALDAPRDVALDAPRDVAPRDVRPPDCDLATTYTFGWHGGLSVYEYSARIAPGRSFTLSRVFSSSWGRDASVATCSTTLARCGESDVRFLELSDALDALEDPDVAAAFAEPPGVRYGADPTVHDSHLFGIERADGRGFFVGDPCEGVPSCRALPAGLIRLRQAFNELLWGQGMRPECAGIALF